MEVEEGLHRIACTIGAGKPLYQHVLVGSSIVWIDAGIAETPQEAIFPYMDRLERDGYSGGGRGQIALITHADVDHFGGLHALRIRYPGLIALAHDGDAGLIGDMSRILRERYRMHAPDGMDLQPERISQLAERGGPPVRIDVTLRGGETLRLGRAGDWKVLHVPGHSAGHIALWEEERRTAIIADAALGFGIEDTAGNLIAPPPYYDERAYVATIRLLMELKPERLYTGHFPVFEGKRAERFLQDSLDAVAEIRSALLTTLRKGGRRALRELCEEVGHRLGRWSAEALGGLADPISAHLAVWRQKGQVERLEDGTYVWNGSR
jgi:glyoxylase-like metal-dependent hydrolase (beta-lactamase superfamily II)